MGYSSLNSFRLQLRQVVFLTLIVALGVLGIVGSGGGGGDGGGGAGTLQLSSATYSANEGVPSVTITVTRTGGSSGAASVDYATSDNTATQPSDYTAASGTLNWADGDAADKTFTVTIADDSTVELTEAFNVTLSNAVTATLGSISSASVSISDNDSVSISGTVSAPSGALAFVQPTLWHHMIAALFGEPVHAAISDLVTPVAGATVAVYEVDAAGTLVSTTPISTATTDSFGAFSMAAPADAPAVKYIVRATGTTETMDSRITGTTVNVDPSTDATSRIIATEVSDLAQLSTQEVTELQEDIAEFIPEIDTSGANATTLSTRLYDRAESGVGQLNVVRSKVSTGQICGHVQSATSTALQDILIVVRDYLDWATRARTYTDASGDYCVNVPVQGATNPDGGNFSGEYIVGAFNRTDDTVDPERSASEWQSTSGTAYTRNEAGKISVPDTTAVNNIDFTLEAGARITGTVKATGSLAAVEGAQVDVRDFDTRRRLATARVEADGSYRVNVIPGTYLIMARNFTMAPYATEVYDGATGTNNRNLGTPVTAGAGDEVTLDFVLETGSELSGTITASSNPVKNTRVSIDLASSSTSDIVNTDRNGEYNIWLKPDSYDVYAHGQRSLALDLSGGSKTADFSASVSAITGHLQDSGSNPVRNGNIRLYLKDVPATDDTTLMAYATSDNNGDFTVYSDQTGGHLIEARIQDDPAIGSIIYNGHTQLLSGDVTTIASVGSSTNVGTINLPDGGVLQGHVYAESSGSATLTPLTNFRVQIRDDDTSAAGTHNQLVDRFLQVRTRGDGSYSVTLPGGTTTYTYDRVKMRDATGNGNCNAVTITAGSTTVLNFYDGDDTCEVNP